MGWHVPWRVGQELLEHGNEQQCTLVVLSSPVTVCAYICKGYMVHYVCSYTVPLNPLTFRCGILGVANQSAVGMCSWLYEQVMS